MPRTAQSSIPRQPTGRLVFSDPSTYTELSRQQRAGQALRLAPGLYALNAILPATAGRALVGILEFTRRWVAAVDWSDWDRCMADLESSNAFLDSALAERNGDRLRLPELSRPTGVPTRPAARS